MPAIKGIYYKHPLTEEAGYWVWLSYGGEYNIIGISQTKLDSVKLVGNTEAKTIALKQAVETQLHTDCVERIALTGWSQEEIDAYAANPPPYCTVDTNSGELVAQPIVVKITPLSLDISRRVQIEVSDGAYTSNTKYG